MTNSKKDILTEMLSHGLTTIQIDTNYLGVDVPKAFRGTTNMRLNLSYKFRSRLELTDFGIVARLSFDRVWYTCRIPWCAVWFMHQGDAFGLFFKDDMPEGVKVPDGAHELIEIAEDENDETFVDGTKQEDKPLDEPTALLTRGHLRLIK